ncbi:hypothetical protein [Ornithinibacillus bavariensis]|uniref:hypothetical protein n=1 Tax=Ornithinibacillus bavariensis TaxID=545502 RepID=UPI000EBF2B5B|nr:hypothetical protein [Ornithinibacillus sp.]
MKRLLIIMLFGIICLVGCSSNTLQEAISDSVYGKFDKPEILYQNDDIGIVLFLTKNEKGEFIICQSSYEKNGLDRYNLVTSGDQMIPIELGKKSEFITLNSIEEKSGDSFNVIWGGIFHHSGAKHVAYKIHSTDEGAKVFQNNVEINKKHVFVDVIEEPISDSYTITFNILDKEGNILFTYN